MIAYAEGSVAAALKELRKANEALSKACETPGPEAWRHIAIACGHTRTAQTQVEHALELDRMAAELEETG